MKTQGFTTMRALLMAMLMSGAVQAQDVREMIITNELASSHWTAIQMDDYARRITEATDGRIQAKVFHSSSLYNDQSALAALGTGAVHMAWPVAVRLETIAPQTGVLSLPFVLSDEVMAKSGAPTAVGEYLSTYLRPKGIEVLGVARTADLFFLTRDAPVATMQDLEGLKVRATGGKVMLELLDQFGASAVSMPATEMGPAMSQGAIDSILTSSGGWDMVGVSTAPDAWLVPGLNLVTYAILVDAMWLSGLPADLQQVVIGTTRDFVENNWAEAKALDEQTLQTVIAKGGRFSTVKEDARQEFVEAAQSVSEAWQQDHPDAWNAFESVLAPYK